MAGWKRPSVSSRNELGLLGAGSLARLEDRLSLRCRFVLLDAFGVLVVSDLSSGLWYFMSILCRPETHSRRHGD